MKRFSFFWRDDLPVVRWQAPLILSLLLLPALTASAKDEDEKIPAIAVVHTWGDLIKTTPFELKDLPPAVIAAKHDASKKIPARLFLGIDRDQVPNHGVVMLYCLSQGLDFSHIGDTYGGTTLGPFDVQVKTPKPDESDEKELQKEIPGYVGNSLFTCRIPIRDSGPYIVELLEPVKQGDKTKPRVYARIKIDATGESSPWVSWGLSPREKALKFNSEAPATIVCNPTGGVAIPRMEGNRVNSDSDIFDTLPALDKPLPNLFPSQPDPGVRLSMAGDTLVLNLKPHGTPETGLYPYDDFESWNDQFLTRWWVNDKPFIPALDPKKDDQSLQRSYTGDNPVGDIRFQLDFRPERLGVTKGDKIGVQLLYCPLGWDSNGSILEMVAKDDGPPGVDASLPPPDITFLSNRVDFTYSGDPKSPQQKQEQP